MLLISLMFKMHLNTTASDGWARFALIGVTAEDSGLYRCSAKVIYPAPVLTLCNASTVDLRLEGRPTLTQRGGAGLNQWKVLMV